MEISELEALLGIKITEAQRPMYEARLAAAVDFINQDVCGRFADKKTGEITLPQGVKMGAAFLVKAMGENPGVSSRTLADMSTTFAAGETRKTAKSFWNSYKRAHFV